MKKPFNFDGRLIENAPILDGQKPPVDDYVVACGACLCNSCRNNPYADLYFRNGNWAKTEPDFPCFICEECFAYDGKTHHLLQAREECQYYKSSCLILDFPGNGTNTHKGG